MLDQINEQLEAAETKLRVREKLMRRLADSQEKLAAAREKCAQLARRHAKEVRDVEKLHGWTLEALFAKIAGNPGERLAKEQKEAAGALLKYEEASQAIEALEQRIAGLEEELRGAPDPRPTHDRLMAEKEQALQTEAPEAAAQLRQTDQRLAAAKGTMREMEEAASAGESALRALDALEDKLRSAGNWGAVDMLGGGMITTAIKHGAISEAKNLAAEAQRRLGEFEFELRDVAQDSSIAASVEVGGLLTFADFFFDGLIADWMVQSKISKAKGRAGECQRQVRKLLRVMEREHAKLGADVAALSRDRAAMLRSA